ncbi:IS5/IS1182 family transposase, partial [Micromonospora sp. NPDC000018]
RARGERAIATLKTWKTLVRLRCCPRRATGIV